MDQRLLKSFVVPLVLFGVPSFLLVLRLWLKRRKITANSGWSDIPRQTAFLFLFAYCLRWALVALFWIKPALQWFMGWLVMWPIIGLMLVTESDGWRSVQKVKTSGAEAQSSKGLGRHS